MVLVNEIPPCTGLDRNLRVPRYWGCHISRKSAHEGGNCVSPTYRPPLSPKKYSRYSFMFQHLVKTSTRNIPGVKGGRCGDELTTFKFRMSWKSGSLKLLEHSRRHRACCGNPLSLPFYVRGWVDPRAIVRPEGFKSMKNTSDTIGDLTHYIPLVAQCLKKNCRLIKWKIRSAREVTRHWVIRECENIW
jgi:hypothetical protein